MVLRFDEGAVVADVVHHADAYYLLQHDLHFKEWRHRYHHSDKQPVQHKETRVQKSLFSVRVQAVISGAHSGDSGRVIQNVLAIRAKRPICRQDDANADEEDSPAFGQLLSGDAFPTFFVVISIAEYLVISRKEGRYANHAGLDVRSQGKSDYRVEEDQN